MTGDLSFLSSFSSLTSLLKTEDVNEHARKTADIATCFSRANASDIGVEGRARSAFLVIGRV